MKKYFVFLLAMIALAGCEGTTIIGNTQQVVNVSVAKNLWLYSNASSATPYANNYFYASVKVPQITADVFYRGEVQAYIVYNQNTKDAMQHLLPYSRHYEEQRNDGTWNYYTETTDCIFGIGWVEFNFSNSDFAYEDNANINPLDMDFRIVITRPAD